MLANRRLSPLAVLAALSAGCGATSAFPLRPLRPDTLENNGWERDCDLLHLFLDVSIDFERRRVTGRATNRIKGLVDGTRRIRLHAAGLDVAGVRDSRGRSLAFDLQEPWLDVELAEELARGAEESLVVEYECSPETGLFFVGTSKDFEGFAPQVYSQGQEEDNRHWIPTWDYPNDRATFEARIRVGEGLYAVSNGALVSVEDHGDGERTFHWLLEQEIPTYLVAVAAGRWERYTDEWNGIPLEYYVAPGTGEEKARRAFGETPAMMDYFTGLLDMPYPYPKYAQVAVADFAWGGMENASVTIQNDYVIGTAGEVQDLDGDPRLLVAHELAHQWFGDLVTCLGWSHLWLNEAWASYLELLFEGHMTTEDNFRLWLERSRETYIGRDTAAAPVAGDWFTQGTRRTNHEYDKGPWILYMIHRELGDGPFWLGVRAYLARHANGLVTTEDFTRALFDATGRNVEGLVEQWVEAGGYPVYDVRFTERVDEDGVESLRLRVRQTQELDELVPLFDMPVDVDLYYAGGEVVRHTLRVRQAKEVFELPLEDELVDVVFDADCRILCALSVDKDVDMWVHQARLPDVAAQWRALPEVRRHAARSDPARRALFDVLASGREPLLRQRAARLCDFPEAAYLLVRAATGDSEARVRREAAQSLLQLALRSKLRLLDWERTLLSEHIEKETSPMVKKSLARVLEIAD